MSAPNLGQTVAMAWEAHVGTTPEDNIHNDYWLFNRLSEGKSFDQVDGGRTVNGPIEYALNTTWRSYSDTEPIDVTRIDVFDEFSYAWKEYAGTVVLTRETRPIGIIVLGSDSYGDDTQSLLNYVTTNFAQSQ